MITKLKLNKLYKENQIVGFILDLLSATALVFFFWLFIVFINLLTI